MLLFVRMADCSIKYTWKSLQYRNSCIMLCLFRRSISNSDKECWDWFILSLGMQSYNFLKGRMPCKIILTNIIYKHVIDTIDFDFIFQARIGPILVPYVAENAYLKSVEPRLPIAIFGIVALVGG